MGSATFVEVLLAIILPPVGVFLRYGCAVSKLQKQINLSYLVVLARSINMSN